MLNAHYFEVFSGRCDRQRFIAFREKLLHDDDGGNTRSISHRRELIRAHTWL